MTSDLQDLIEATEDSAPATEPAADLELLQWENDGGHVVDANDG